MALIPHDGYPRFSAADRPFTDVEYLSIGDWCRRVQSVPVESAQYICLTGREPDSNHLIGIAPGLDGVNINDFDLDDFEITRDYDSAIMIVKEPFVPLHRIYFTVCPPSARELSKDVGIFTEIPGHDERVRNIFVHGLTILLTHRHSDRYLSTAFPTSPSESAPLL